MLTENQREGIKLLLSTGLCQDDTSTLNYFSKDVSYHSHHIPSLVFCPKSEEDVMKGLSICTNHLLKVTCAAGKTSLEGGSIPDEGAVVFDTTLMDEIKVNKSDLDAVVGPGVNWVDLNRLLEKDGLTLSNDPGMGACLGGMVATNCSGTLAYRYGTIKDNIISLRVVTPTGIFQTRRRPTKSSAGFDLTRLFVGSEGTLGITTQITLKLRVIQKYKGVVIARFVDVESAGRAAQGLVVSGILLNRIEFMDDWCVKSVNIAHSKEYLELPTLIMEVVGMDKREVQVGVEMVEKICLEYGGRKVERGEDELWHLRKSAFFSAKKLRERKSEVLTTDCAVPISRLKDLLRETRKDLDRLNLTASIVAHAGDGNLHALILVDPSDKDEVDRAEEFRRVNAEYAISLDGTCTGEHGIGIGKRELLIKELGRDTVDVMRRIKKVLDPNGIMNPGKVFEMEDELQKGKL